MENDSAFSLKIEIKLKVGAFVGCLRMDSKISNLLAPPDYVLVIK